MNQKIAQASLRRGPAPFPLAMLVFCLLAGPAAPAVARAADTRIVGWVEKGVIEPENITVKMKMDSGALSSSIDAKNIELFKKDGAPWVRFRLEMKDVDSKTMKRVDFQRPVERDIKVRGAGGVDHRPVVRLQVCIGREIYTEEFSLRDRKHMIYPVLIGREVIGKLGLIDVKSTFTADPHCRR